MRFRLQEYRIKAGFKSAKAFAEHMGINPYTYTNYEQGVSNLTLAQAWAFADELGCTIDELAGREVPDQAPVIQQFTNNELRIINAYRAASPQGRAAIEAVAQSQEGMEGQPSSDMASTA